MVQIKPALGSYKEPGYITEDVADRFLGQLDGAWSKPGHAVVFATGSRPSMHWEVPYTDDMLQGSSPLYFICSLHRTTFSRTVRHTVSSHLPCTCQLVVGRVDGVVGTLCGGRGAPTELEHGQGLSGLFLPSILPDGVQVRPFTVTLAHAMTQFRKGVSDELKSQVGLPVGDELLSLKCALFFASGQLDDSERCAVCNILSDLVPSRCAVGGSWLDSLVVSDDPAENVFCTGLCFLGEGVRAASAVLSPEVRGTQAVEKVLQQLKTDSGFGGWETGRTVGFMFACSERGSEFHGKANVEAGAFASVFPGVPLVGTFSGALIGSECLVDWYTDDLRRTVLVLLGLGGS
ncbi:unnamed protein product [Ixodes hexagonus]